MVKRQARIDGDQWSAERPILRFRCWTNARRSGSSLQTLGRNNALVPRSRRISPSRPGWSLAISSSSSAKASGVAGHCQALISRGVENILLQGGAPYDVVFANILAKPLRLLAPSLAAVTARDGEAIVSGLLSADVPGVLAAWRAQGFSLRARFDLDGWASLRLGR